MNHDTGVILVAIIYGVTNLVGTVYAAHKATGAKSFASDIKDSVGAANGSTLAQLAKANHELLEKLAALSKYQHRRNHDIMTLQHGNALRMYLIARHFGIDMPEPPKLDPSTEGESDAL